MSNNIKVLLVDDFALARALVKAALSELGITNIDNAANVKDAFEKISTAHAAQTPFEVVFCDFNMPNGTAVDLLTMCRSKPEYKNLKFVIISSESGMAFVNKSLKAGANDFIAKPIGHEELKKKISHLLAEYAKAS